MGIGGFGITGVLILLLWVLPIIHVIISDRSRGPARFLWFVAVLIFSWVGYIVYLLATRRPKSLKN